ncbi:FG-GAP-like repeat-containing protein [Lentzea aerocolonigenes]|uniref:FG-GAP-like repeat-containing protein n=1 Tax=Lentzea aerocolonigenes TaxID=68170 RepID=UPI0006972911|nr:FG-GAP-like repeat-containing protein [Lentzea aerocolonigenes]
MFRSGISRTGTESKSVGTGLRKTTRTVLSAALAVMAGTVLMAPPASAAPSRDRIVDVAAGKVGEDACSPGFFNSCGMAWCAEFARWVWKEGGVSDLKGLDGWAQSFKTYGKNNGTYHSRSSGYKPQPGDAIVFDWDHKSGDDHPIDHVAIVTSSSATTVNTIGGNQGDPSRVRKSSYQRSNGDIDGYISPVGIGDGGGGGEKPVVNHSVTGDSFTDLVGRKPDGTIWAYNNNILRDNGVPYTSGREIGHGWNAFDTVLSADVTGDGYTDLVARKPDGTLWLYANDSKNDGLPYSSGRQIGNGWNVFDTIVGADLTGDGYAELVGRKPDGTIWMYANNIVRDNGKPYSSGREIGHGWNVFDMLVAADVTGDGYAEMVGRKADGTLWMYANNIVRDNGQPYSSGREIGHGWNAFDTIIGANVTGDAFADLVARKADGTILLYSNNILRDNGQPYSSGRQIGSSWNIFDVIM